MSEQNVTLIVKGKMLIDGLGGPPITPGLVAIAGRRIVFAGSGIEAPRLPVVQMLDFPEACLLPGLIDMHIHPTYYWNEPNAIGYTAPDPRTSTGYSPAMITLLAVSRLREALMAGVTTGRDTGGVGGIMFDVKRAIQMGMVPGPKIYVAGHLIVSTGGHVHYRQGLGTHVDGPFGFRQAVREEVRAGADLIKVANRGRDMTLEELDAAVDEAHCLGKKVACHTWKPPSQRWAIEAGVDTFEHGTPTPEEIDLAVQKGVAWTPTINASLQYLRWCDHHRKGSDAVLSALCEQSYAETSDYLERQRASVAYALKAGLRISAGTDSYLVGVRFAAMADEMSALVEFGCSPMQAIQAATYWPALAMGWSDDIGSLEPGKLADLIAVDGDPLTDIAAMDRIALVVREGEVVRSDREPILQALEVA